ncbi:MAG: MBL fold metallo-hydrolase [Gammaproteobacteria bacterium]|nr:MBL fold metallo-hydrolase [Gammaproteobacteria bacterium]
MNPNYLRFWGVRGSHAAPHASHIGTGGNTSCVEIQAAGHLLVCDGGTGLIPLGERLAAQSELRELLVIFTHYHWDHICGLPFFVPAFLPDWKIRFFGPGQTAADINRHISNQMKAPYFPVETETWMADIEYLTPAAAGLQHGPMHIRYQSVHHPGVTYGYRITIGTHSIVYASDNEVDYLSSSIARRASEFTPDETVEMRDIADEERRADLDFVRGADILIHDAQYTRADYERKRGWGHSCYIDTVNFAIDAGVKTLYLFHHDPSYDDEQVAAIHRESLKIIHDRNATLNCKVAREGMVVEF